MPLAKLSIDLEARVATLERDFSKAVQSADRTGKAIEARFAKVGESLKGLGAGLVAGLSFAALQQAVRSTVDGLDALNDAADATGASIENLSALEDVGKRTGTSFDTVSSILVKFNAQLKEAGGENSPAARALKAIGLEAEQLRAVDPAEALRQTAAALSAFADDGNKARLVQELFGKSVKEAAPFLKDLAEAGQLNATVTAEQAQEAEKFNKILFETQANIQGIARGIANSLLPAFNEFIARIKTEGASVDNFFKNLRADLTNTLRAGDVEEQGRLIERLQKLLAEGADKPGASFFSRNEVFNLRKEIEALGRQASVAGEKVKAVLGTGQQAAALTDKQLIFGGDRFGDRQSVQFDESGNKSKGGAQSPTVGRIEAPERLRLPRNDSDRQLADVGRLLASLKGQEERAQGLAASFAEQANADSVAINLARIKDDEERGRKQIDIERITGQQRLAELALAGADITEATAALNANIVAQQASLTEQLRPEWQRMLDGWSDVAGLMGKTFDDLVTGVIGATADTITGLVADGKADLDGLVSFVQRALARIVAEKAIAGIVDAASLIFGGFSVGPAALGKALGPSGEITAFANGGVFGRPTLFNYGNGRRGVLGEAGPEAIMPLARDSNGRLGVRGGGGTTINLNVASGVTRAELAAMLPTLEATIEGRIVARSRRPGSPF